MSSNGDSAKKVLLVDVDNKYRESKRRGKRFPNLALMKISAYEKAQGNVVGFDTQKPDRTYISCVFPRNRLYAIKECCEVERGLTFGGSGISLSFNLLPQIDLMKPDYSLYDFCNYSLGFTTRGCPNGCPWCIVPEKEGAFRRVQHISQFHDSRFKSCKLLDNNILVDRDWFFENTDWAIENKVRLCITQGMDIRLLTDEIADQLAKIKFVDGQIRFAWDRVGLEDKVKAGIEMLRERGINVKRNLGFYVLVGYHEPGRVPAPFCQDAYRCNKLREWGCLAFAMPFNEEKTPLITALARWTSRRAAYKASPFWKYERNPSGVTA